MVAAVMDVCRNVRRVVWWLFMCCIVIYRVAGIYPLRITKRTSRDPAQSLSFLSVGYHRGLA